MDKGLFSNLKFSYKYIRNQRWKLFLFGFLNLLGVAVSILTPILSARIIIYLTAEEYKRIIFVALAILATGFFTNIINHFTRKISQSINRCALGEIELDLAKNVLRIQNKSIDENGTGVFIQRMNSDVSRIADVFGRILDMTANIIAYIGVFGAIFYVNHMIFVFVVITTFGTFLIEKMRASIRNKNDKELRKSKEKLSSFISEMVRGSKDIKLLNSEEGFINEMDSRIKESFGLQYKMELSSSRSRFFSWTFDDFSKYVLITLLVLGMISNSFSPSNALILYNYSQRSSGFSWMLGNVMEMFKDFNLSCNRVRDIIEGENFPKEKFGKKTIKEINGNFEFKNVDFSYTEDKPVLKDLNFKINANETVAFVGRSGSGKTTIFNLLCRMYDVNDGEILVDGNNINTLNKDSLRGNITVISQNPYIFNMSIRDNFRLVKENLTEEEMIEASKVAAFDEFVSTLKNGYDTIIGEGGVNLSGGEKQRLAIARALIQKTKIILFDEATSALDNITQSKIEEAINNLRDDYTILIIAHRLSTIINADRILFLEDGSIKAEGTHKELLKKSKEYKELYEKEIIKK